MSVNIVVPEVGESITDARVVRWLKQQGEAVAAGEALVELETDKVNVEVSAPQAGVLQMIAHGPGADVKVGDVLGAIEPGAASAAPAKAEPAVAAAAATRSAGAEKVAATPSARKLAREQNVELGSVTPAGPRVTADDIRRSAGGPPSPPAAQRAPAPPPVASGQRTETRVRMSKRRATIAKRLVQAQQTAAMLTTFNEADMSAVMALRARHKDSFRARYGVSLGIASFFVRASIVALREFPRVNAEIQGDEMILKSYYDIGVAVGTEEGLVVPVLRDADRMSFARIEQGIRDFASRANDGRLTIEDLRGGTFSITNGGVYGSLMSTPILSPPQVAILGLHAINERPVGVNGQIVLRPMMYLALTYDHRIIDGAEAVRFLVRIKQLVEDPASLAIEG
jgi:2-oxoglutarate dehydrogenase E2 component (dihydrolipoamide succinyltransferase)